MRDVLGTMRSCYLMNFRLVRYDRDGLGGETGGCICTAERLTTEGRAERALASLFGSISILHLDKYANYFFCTISASIVIETSSPTTTPPLSIVAFHFTPKS